MTTAVVMGASRGLGRAVAIALTNAGHRVHLLARSSAALAEAVAAAGPRATPHVVDVGDGRALTDTLRDIGDVDILVANAGGPKPGGLTDLTDGEWEAAWQMTMMSTVRAVRTVAPGMTARGNGRIIVIGSSGTRQPIKGLLLSNVYRAGVLALVKSLAPELAPHSVTINMVSPGRILTDRIRALDADAAARAGIAPEEASARSIARIPAGRYGDPDEFAAVVAFFASPEASYVTGQSLLVDGGMVNALP